MYINKCQAHVIGGNVVIHAINIVVGNYGVFGGCPPKWGAEKPKNIEAGHIAIRLQDGGGKLVNLRCVSGCWCCQLLVRLVDSLFWRFVTKN